MRGRTLGLIFGVAITALPSIAAAQGLTGPAGDPVRTAVALAVLGLAPLLLVVITSFAKFVVVLGLLRSALGAGQVPPNIVLASLALMLSGFVMAPTFGATVEASGPWLDGGQEIIDTTSAQRALSTVSEPWRAFLAANASEDALTFFSEIRDGAPPLERLEDAPLVVAAPAFAITELSEAFQIGFLLFLPFVVLDLLIGSVLLSLGMHMLSPTSVSMPFKLLLFVLVNGWLVLSEALVLGYVQPGGV